jgi:hypothetical protein
LCGIQQGNVPYSSIEKPFNFISKEKFLEGWHDHSWKFSNSANLFLFDRISRWNMSIQNKGKHHASK